MGVNYDLEPMRDESRPVRQRRGNRFLEENYVLETSHSQKITGSVRGPDRIQWQTAFASDFMSLQENDTWELYELPDGRKAI